MSIIIVLLVQLLYYKHVLLLDPVWWIVLWLLVLNEWLVVHWEPLLAIEQILWVNIIYSDDKLVIYSNGCKCLLYNL